MHMYVILDVVNHILSLVNYYFHNDQAMIIPHWNHFPTMLSLYKSYSNILF